MGCEAPREVGSSWVVFRCGRWRWPRCVQQVALLHDDQASIVAGTVADNLRFAQPSVSLLQMRDALVAASLWDEVSALPLGLDTPLLSGAPGWSPSMRWRLVLTRLLLQKPKLVLIDGLHDTEWELTPLLSMDAPWTLVCGQRGWTSLATPLYERVCRWSTVCSARPPERCCWGGCTMNPTEPFAR
jgi:hypothetical protein